jgi:hypothetical protein
MVRPLWTSGVPVIRCFAAGQDRQGCCQTESNWSRQGQDSCPLGRTETTPLGESGGAVGLDEISAGEASFLVKVV